MSRASCGEHQHRGDRAFGLIIALTTPTMRSVESLH
jgi:hypothetical protein